MSSIRELIMQNVKTTLEAILNVAPAVAAANNSTPPNGLCVETSGSFTSTARTVYEVEITTGGKSGIARATVTDKTFGTDSVVGTVVVTSGTDIALGINGGKVKFAFGVSEVLTAGDKWTIVCSTYNRTVRQVLRYKAAGMNLSIFDSCVIGAAGQDYDESPESAKYANSMLIAIDYWAIPTGEQSMDAALTEALEDMENALRVDPSRGGNAQDTTFRRCEPGIPIDGKPYGVMSLEILVRFNQVL